ncbi:9009_t:CDS:2, partial [Cetraspora pellucida]
KNKNIDMDLSKLKITNEPKITNESNSNNINSDCTSIRLAKKAAVQDSERLKEILGVKTRYNVAKIESIPDFKNSYNINQGDPESVINNLNKNEKDHFSDVNGFQTIVNKLNTQDYFSLKAKQKNLAESAENGIFSSLFLKDFSFYITNAHLCRSAKYFEDKSDDERPCFNIGDLNLTNKGSIYFEFVTEESKERKAGVNLNCDPESHNYFKSTVNSLEARRKRKGKEGTVSRKLKKKNHDENR